MKEKYHCSGCEWIIKCKNAFKPQSGLCGYYVRSSYHQCHKCLRFGEECQKTGLIECKFLARIPTTSLQIERR